MKLKDASYIIKPEILDNMDVDIGSLITQQEFMGRNKGCYRERALNTLIGIKADFKSNDNIIFQMFSKFVNIICPDCSTNMNKTSFGGGPGGCYFSFKCDKCSRIFSITVQSDSLSSMVDNDK